MQGTSAFCFSVLPGKKRIVRLSDYREPLRTTSRFSATFLAFFYTLFSIVHVWIWFSRRGEISNFLSQIEKIQQKMFIWGDQDLKNRIFPRATQSRSLLWGKILQAAARRLTSLWLEQSRSSILVTGHCHDVLGTVLLLRNCKFHWWFFRS